MTGNIPPRIDIPEEMLPPKKLHKPDVVSIAVGHELKLKEAECQTDTSEIETSIEQMEMIITDDIEEEKIWFDDTPILEPPTSFEDTQKITSKISKKEKDPVKLLNTQSRSTPAKQFKKSNFKKERTEHNSEKPKILNSQIQIPKLDEPNNTLIDCIEETPDGNIQIVTYGDTEYLDEAEDMKPRVADPERDVFTCSTCDRSFPLQQQLDIHVRNHTRARDHPCQLCDKAFFTKYDLGKHFLTHTKQKDYTCIVCNKSFSRSTLLYRHEKIHNDPNIKRFKCKDCPRIFLNELDYRKHIDNHAKTRNFKCSFCSKRFAFKQGLERHEVIHDMESMPNVCQYCEMRFPSAAKLQRHLASAHAGSRPFPCSRCKKRFMLSHHLYRHTRTSHQNDSTMTFQCPDCTDNVLFDNREEFIDHCLVHAVETLVCPLCRAPFDNIDHASNHIVLHSKSDMYFCDYCNLVYLSQDELNNHFTDMHSNELCSIGDEVIEFIVDNRAEIKEAGDKRKRKPSFSDEEGNRLTSKVSKDEQFQIMKEDYADQNIDNMSFIEYEEIELETQEPSSHETQKVISKLPQSVSVKKVAKRDSTAKKAVQTYSSSKRSQSKAITAQDEKNVASKSPMKVEKIKMSQTDIKKLQDMGKIEFRSGQMILRK